MTFLLTSGVIPVAQPPESITRLEAAVAALDPFTLAALSTLVTLSGALVCGLTIVEGGREPAAVWQAAEVDEAWQSEQWGEVAEAAARNRSRASEFSIAGALCATSRM